MRTKHLSTKSIVSEKTDLTGQRVEILYVWAKGSNYENLQPGTVHTIIPSPNKKGHNTLEHVWVKGSPDPVCILEGEFIILKKSKRTKLI